MAIVDGSETVQLVGGGGFLCMGALTTTGFVLLIYGCGLITSTLIFVGLF